MATLVLGSRRGARDLGTIATPMLLLACALILGCGRTPHEAAKAAPAAPPAAATAQGGQPGATPAAAEVQAASPPSATTITNAPAAPSAAAGTSAEAAAEIAGYASRRKRVRPVIGGCEESCERPERTLNALIAGLCHADANERFEALVMLFDWSQLVADGQVLGDGWAELWDDVRNHPRRDAEIRAWLLAWSGWSQRLAPGANLSSMRGAQTRLEAVPGHADLMLVHLRHPALVDDTTEPEWRVLLTRRGWEWLVAEIDHSPSKRPLRLERFGGSEQAGHL